MAEMEYLEAYSEDLEDAVRGIIKNIANGDDASYTLGYVNPIGEVYTDGENTYIRIGVFVTIPDFRVTDRDPEEVRKIVTSGLSEFISK